jgi:hypothetical protein
MSAVAFETYQGMAMMSAHRGKADIPPQGRDFRFWTAAQSGHGFFD